MYMSVYMDIWISLSIGTYISYFCTYIRHPLQGFYQARQLTGFGPPRLAQLTENRPVRAAGEIFTISSCTPYSPVSIPFARPPQPRSSIAPLVQLSLCASKRTIDSSTVLCAWLPAQRTRQTQPREGDTTLGPKRTTVQKRMMAT